MTVATVVGGRGARTRACACPLAAVVRAVAWETADGRLRVHRARGVVRCDARVAVGPVVVVRAGTVLTSHPPHCSPDCVGTDGGGWPGHRGVALRLSGGCECLTYLTDAVSTALVYLDSRSDHIVDPGAAVRRHVRSRQHDHVRAERVAQGAQARTDRIEGGVIGRALATREQRWLLRDVAEEAGSTSPLEDDLQLRRRLAERRARRTGEDVDEQRLMEQVRSDLEVVREAAVRVGRRVDVGTPEHPEVVSWWEAYVERPLGRRQRRSTQPWDEHPWGHEQVTAPLREAAEPADPRGTALRQAVREVRAVTERDPAAGLQQLLAQLVARGVVPEATAAAVLGDPWRRALAVEALSAVRGPV